MNAPVTSDRVLLRNYLSGDRDAISQLIERHSRRVRDYIRMMVKDRDVAEDIVQETFIKAVRVIDEGRYTDNGKFLSWILRIAHNQVIDYFRAQRQNTRDIMQDLADTAAGIAVVHQADEEKLRKEQKRARQAARQAQKVRSLEKLVLTGDLDNLTYSQRRGLEKHLSEERMAELMEQRGIRTEQMQTSLFA